MTPTEQTTPESYLGYQRAQFVAGERVQEDQMTSYQPPDPVPQDMYAYSGSWSVASESATAGSDAQLLLRFEAKDAYLVLGGTGTVEVSVDGRHTRTVAVLGRAAALPAGRPESLPAGPAHPDFLARRAGLRFHLRLSEHSGPAG